MTQANAASVRAICESTPFGNFAISGAAWKCAGCRFLSCRARVATSDRSQANTSSSSCSITTGHIDRIICHTIGPNCPFAADTILGTRFGTAVLNLFGCATNRHLGSANSRIRVPCSWWCHNSSSSFCATITTTYRAFSPVTPSTFCAAGTACGES